MKNKLLSILLLGLLATCLTGCGEVNYTENMIRVREKYNPWYLSSKMKAGEIYDKVLKNTDWKDNGDTVIISGIDKKTGKRISITYEIKRNTVDVKKMIVNGEEKDYFYWYKYMTSYLE